MNDPKSFAAGIYYGIPRFFGEFFRATKIPTIILLLGLIVVPAVLAVFSVVYMSKTHSTHPMDLFVSGLAQFKIDSDPHAAENLPPNLAALMKRTTPQDKELGKKIVGGFFAFSLLLWAALLWWCFSAARFIKKKLTRKTSSSS
jgi:hypothetical protein